MTKFINDEKVQEALKLAKEGEKIQKGAAYIRDTTKHKKKP